MDKGLPEGGDPKNAWRARPVGGGLLRAAMVLIPALAGAIVASLLTNLMPLPEGARQTIAWLLLIVTASIVTVVLLTRFMKRFAPLAFLLSLTLVFPDSAPSRFKVARSAVRLKGGNERDFKEAASGSEGAGQVLALIAALGSHDKRTRGHSERVRVFTEMLAEEMHITPTERNKLRWAALLHDVGKLKVPPTILNKPGRPNEEEWDVLQRHPTEGIRIAAPLLGLLGPWAAAIEHHHERFDGKGYPSGLAGEDIPYSARILAVSDAYEVMTAARPYKTPMTARAARSELVASSGTHFDPTVVRSFLNISIGRLWRGIGLASMLAQLPLLGTLFQRGVAQRVGRDVLNLSTAGVMTVSMAAVGFMGGPVSPPLIETGPSMANEIPEAIEPAGPLPLFDRGSDDKPANEDSRGVAHTEAPGIRHQGTDVAAPREQPEQEARSDEEDRSSEEEPRPQPSEDPEPPPPEPEDPPDDYFASGQIAAPTPASALAGGATQSEFLLSCGVPGTQGVDGWVFEVPEESSAPGGTAGITGTTDDPLGYNLDVFFYSEGCTSLGTFEGAGSDEAGPLPPETRYIVVNQPQGLDTEVSLAVTY